MSNLRADGSLYQTPALDDITGATAEDQANKAIGAGVGVMMFGQETVAEIVSGRIAAKALDVDADLGFTASSVVVKAGHIPDTADFGLGGAIAVHLAKTSANAVIGKNASYYIGSGSVNVASVGSGNYVTVGDASGKRTRRSFSVAGIQIPLAPANSFTSSSTGIGAGIAVGLTGIDVTAMIEDGVRFGGSPLQSLTVIADYTGKEHVEAAAGAAGGRAIVPVLALSVSGLATEAYLSLSLIHI